VPTAVYNELEHYPAEWLRDLISAGLIAPGEVLERDVRGLRPEDLSDAAQVHLFAGIGVWSYALRLAGWPDDLPVWTGSCPCQPFSTAGKRQGTKDDRHLWPEFFRLIQGCRPPVILGEQVASKAGLAWLDDVQADLEGAGYAVGAVDLCAAGVGAPHLRQRLWFVAHDTSQRQYGSKDSSGATRRGGSQDDSPVGRLADDLGAGLEGREGQPELAGDSGGLGHAPGEREEAQYRTIEEQDTEPQGSGGSSPGPTNGFWSPADWVLCRDPSGPRWRPIEPGTFPLAHGSPARVGRLRAYGNAIVAPLAAEFVGAVMGCLGVEP
jgi:DNA (cytosine-5)-methyltransferase 1